MDIKLSFSSPEQTVKLAESIGNLIKSPVFICLTGDLGTGKTTFTKGLASGLGITRNITSPTFTLMNEYMGSELRLIHIDVYRLDNPQEIFQWDLDEYLKDSVVVIEWADRIKIPDSYNYIDIVFDYAESEYNERNITLATNDAKYEKILEEAASFVNTRS